MPLTRISLRRGKTAEYRLALMDQVYEAMRETFDVPVDDRFMLVTEHDEGSFNFGRRYLGIDRSDDLIIIQITANNTRTAEKKQALYKRIAERLAASPGVRPQDLFINILEVPKENCRSEMVWRNTHRRYTYWKRRHLREFFSAPFPVTTTIQIGRLYNRDLMIDITAVAEIPRKRFRRPG